MDQKEGFNESLMGFGVFYEMEESYNEDWLMIGGSKEEPGNVLYIGAKFKYEDDKEMRNFIRRIDWAEIGAGYWDWMF